MNPRAINSKIESIITQLKSLQAIFKLSPREAELKGFVTILQNLYIEIDEKEEYAKEDLDSLTESLRETEALITSLLNPSIRLTYNEESLTILFAAINDYVADMGTVFVAAEEEIDEEKEEEEEEEEEEKIEEIGEKTEATPPAMPASTIVTMDVLNLAEIDFEEKQPAEMNNRYETIILKQLEIENLIKRIVDSLIAEEKVLLQHKLNLKEENAEIKLDIVAFIKTRDALISEERKIKQSTFKSEKHRKEHPIKIANCHAMIQKHQAAHNKNLNAIKTLELRFNAFQKIVDKLQMLGETLQDHQQHSKVFDYAQCKADIQEIEIRSQALLDNETSSVEKQKAANDIFEQIEAMQTVYAPLKDRMNALKSSLALQPQRTPIKLGDANDEEQPSAIELLINAISQTQHNMQHSLDYYTALAKDPKNNPVASKTSKRRDDLASINNKLNNIIFGLEIHPNAQFYQLAEKELPLLPQVFNAPNYLNRLREWANKNNAIANAILADELKQQDIQEEPKPQEPSFFSHIWRNKFTILGMLLGGAGGAALGIFTFGLSTVGLHAILIYAAAVGSSAMGGACTNGFLGWCLDRWIEPVEELPPLPPSQVKRHLAEPKDDDESDDEDLEEGVVVRVKHDNNLNSGRQKLSQKERGNVNVSGSKYSFQNQGGHANQGNVAAVVENKREGYRR